MTGLALLIVSGGLPFLPAGVPLAQQSREAVAEGLWIDWTTLQAGVEWSA